MLFLLMNAMILDWRALWGYEFPFYITQIAGFKPVTLTPGDNDWAGITYGSTTL